MKGSIFRYAEGCQNISPQDEDKQITHNLCSQTWAGFLQIRRGIHARELSVVRFGNSYSIAVDDLRAWFNQKKGVL